VLCVSVSGVWSFLHISKFFYFNPYIPLLLFITAKMFFTRVLALLFLTFALASATLQPAPVLYRRQQADTANDTMSATGATSTATSSATSSTSSDAASAPTVVSSGGSGDTPNSGSAGTAATSDAGPSRGKLTSIRLDSIVHILTFGLFFSGIAYAPSYCWKCWCCCTMAVNECARKRVLHK
jgi:hypothetical protein